LLWKSYALLKDSHKDQVTDLQFVSYTMEVMLFYGVICNGVEFLALAKQ